MRTISAALQARLDAGEVSFRNLLWIGARLRTTGALAERGWWSDVGTRSFDVLNGDGSALSRVYIGGGDLVQIGPVPMVLGLVAQQVSIRLSLVSQAVEEVIREWEPKRASVEIHRVMLDPISNLQVLPAERRFIGFVDNVDISTPPENDEGYITLTCASMSQELLRSSDEKRSDASQRLRNPNDAGLQHVAALKNWKLEWGDKDGAG